MELEEIFAGAIGGGALVVDLRSPHGIGAHLLTPSLRKDGDFTQVMDPFLVEPIVELFATVGGLTSGFDPVGQFRETFAEEYVLGHGLQGKGAIACDWVKG